MDIDDEAPFSFRRVGLLVFFAPDCSGMGGLDAVESVARMAWNTHFSNHIIIAGVNL